jgi:hypothetical protein
MLFNIIFFFVVLIVLILSLYNSKTYKEGFFDFPDNTHNNYVDSSADKFNSLTNLINPLNSAVPINETTRSQLNNALNSVIAEPSSTSYTLKKHNDFTIPSSVPSSFRMAKLCESKGPSCDAFDDPTFASNCGISFDINGVGVNGKPHIGGMFVSNDDRLEQTLKAQSVLDTGSAPYDPYKVYKPTLGRATPGTFALSKDKCLVVKEKVDCKTKQSFNSPNCAQCYTSQTFSRVGPETGRLPSSINLYGSGSISIMSDNNTIKANNTTLDVSNPITVTIPENAEGMVFDINISPLNKVPSYICGFIQGQTPNGVFKLDLSNLIQSDKITNMKPRINGSLVADGFKCLTMIPGNGQTTMSLSCIIPFSFLNMYDGDAMMCDNGPIITQENSATFLESDPCFGKGNKPGSYSIECLQNRWIELGGTDKGTGFPSNQTKADALQKNNDGTFITLDMLLNNLSDKMIEVKTGRDKNGKSLSLNDWNTLSMWATGIPVNTPCDGVNSDIGPLSQECLSYLYLNQGINSHIGPTYTLPPSSVANFVGQPSINIPNTYCLPGTSIDPSTPDGLQFGKKLGGITSVKQTYDQINRLANDNTQTNDKRRSAIKQCYNITLDETMPQ